MNNKALNITASHPRAKRKRSTIIRQLGILNLLSYGALGFSAPYLNLYLKEIGLSATLIGVLISVGALIELALTPLMNRWADRRGRHRALFKWQMGAIVAANLVLALTHLPQLFMGGAYLTNAIHVRPGMEMLSQLTMTRLDEFKRNILGRVRLWGSVGWAISAIVSGTLVAIGGYPMAFIASAGGRMAMFAYMGALPQETANPEERAEHAPRGRAVYLLMASQFIFWIGLNAYIAFLWIHLREGLGISPEHIGYFAAFFAIAELLPMLFIDALISRFGLRKILIIGSLGMAIEWLVFGLLPSWHSLILIQLIRGLTFTMYTISMTILISRISKPVNAATNRALIMVTMPALAMLLTSPIFGWLYDNIGATGMFATTSVFGFAATLVLIFGYRHLAGNEHQAASA